MEEKSYDMRLHVFYSVQMHINTLQMNKAHLAVNADTTEVTFQGTLR